MKSALRELSERLGHVRGTSRVLSGSPADLVLRRPVDRIIPRPIDAMRALVRRGMTVMQAKRAIEQVVEEGQVLASPPMVEDVETLIRELGEAGIPAQVAEAGAHRPEAVGRPRAEAR